jgi:hypothetical protein
MPPPARLAVYELTDHGRELSHIVLELEQWGERSPRPPVKTQRNAPSAKGNRAMPTAAMSVGIDDKIVDRLRFHP